MTGAVLQAMFSHWRAKPLQLVTFLAGLALATALWSGVQAINSEARASYDRAAATLGEGQYDQIVPRRGDTIPLARFIALRQAGWLVSPVIEGRIQGARLVGIDPLTAPGDVAAGTLSTAVPLQVLLSEGRIFADAETAARLDLPVQVVIDRNIAPGIAVTDIGLASRLLQQPDLTRLIVAPNQPLGQAPLNGIAPDLRLSPSQQRSDVGELTDSFHLNLTAFGLLSFAVGIFIVHSTIGLALEQRRGMIRTLRALGVPLNRIIAVILLEILILAMLGATVGIALGYVVAAVLLPDVAATISGLYGASVAGTLQLRPEWWLSGLVMALIGTVIALSGRLFSIATLPLLESARPRAWVQSGGHIRTLQAIASITLLISALLLALLGSGLVAGFVLLGCLLIGAALALPIVLDWGLSQAQTRAKSAKSGWFWADTRQQLPGLSLALMALLLALSANIGVSTMVSSFRLTFVAFLDQRLAPELYLSVESPDQAIALQDYLSSQNIETLPLLSQKTTLANVPAELFGIRVGRTYQENWVLLDQTDAPWDRVATETGVITNEQLARRAGLWVGDTLPLTPDLSLPIVGIVGDYGNPLGQAVVSETLYQSLFPAEVPTRFGLRTETPSDLRAALTNDVGVDPSAITDQASIKAFSLEVFERTFTVTAALNILTLAVAGFALLMSLLTLIDQRIPQLAPVWALGLTRRDLGRLEILRSVALALLVCLCAVPLGLALAWVLLAIVNVEAFGWRLPMFLFPADYGWLGLSAIGAAVLAALWPALRLARTPPSDLLKVFANER